VQHDDPIAHFNELLDDDAWWQAALTDPEFAQAPSQPDSHLLAMLIDWPTFWRRENADPEWLIEPVIAAGRGHVIYAPGGTGKSLFSLWLAASLATGRAGLDNWPLTPRHVLYIDYEMTEDDIWERLETMGYDATCDLSRLHYASLPALAPADVAEGGKAINRMAELVGADLVVFDTFARAVEGDENDAGTVRAFYRFCGIHLKSAGRAFVRIDHAGKNAERGQRGSSAKNDDVDVVWSMTAASEGFNLHADKRRMGWVPENVALRQNDTPSLHYRTAVTLAPVGTDRVVADLIHLAVPLDASVKAAQQALKDAGLGARRQLVASALKLRRGQIRSAMDL
jgi:hypothetical protein